MRSSRLILGLAALLGLDVAPGAAHRCRVACYTFAWRGQFAGFIVNGRFCYDMRKEYPAGVVREEDLFVLTVRFYSPTGALLEKYKNNHLVNTTNFAFSPLSEELLQDGTFDVDDDELLYRNGFNMGAGDPTHRYENGVQHGGMAFWSRPADGKTPHLHVDDWNDADGAGVHGFPIGYSTHEDASFAYATTQDKIASGKVGAAYYDATDPNAVVNRLASDVAAFGQTVRVTPVKPWSTEKGLCPPS